MAICEDYPCCGHTDGLGCEWVSPNEVLPCDTCIEARAPYPYHNRVTECPTERERAQRDIPTGSVCEFYTETGLSDCDGDAVRREHVNGREIFVCESCYYDGQEALREEMEYMESLR